jgi:hypothetical protein
VPRKRTKAAATPALARGAKTQADALAVATAVNKQKFLDAYAGTGNISAAAKLAGVGRRTHYDWIKDDAEYLAAYSDAVDEAGDRLETEARRRAVSGVREAVWHKGVQVGSVQRYSDTLLIFLLKGARPEKYAEHHTVGGKGRGGAIPLELIVAGPAVGAQP